MRQCVPALAVLVALSQLTIESVAAAPSPTPQHDVTHPLVMQQAGDSVATAHMASLQPFKPTPLLPAVGGAGGPLREVFGFALASSLGDPTIGYPSWNFSMLSTVAFFGLHVRDDGLFAQDAGSGVWNSSQLSGLLATAHAHGVKVVLTIILQDFSPGTPHMCSALTVGGRTVAATVAEVRAKGVDGVNVDFEGLNGSCGTGDPSGARHAFTNLVRALRASLPAGSYLSVDTYASSATDPLGFFDIAALAPSVDSFFVMAYDLEYANYSRAPTSCASFCLGPTAPLAGYYYNQTSTVSQYTSVVSASKVILGVPYYGRKACVGPGVANSYPTSAVVADSYLDATGEATYPLTAPNSYSIHRDANDPGGQERWDTWLNTQLNCTRELYWDDTVSLSQKYALVNRSNLRGVGIWSLNYGGGAPELWSALSTYFSCSVTVNTPATQTTTKFSVVLTAAPCAVNSFDVEQYDNTFNQGWFPIGSVAATNGAATVSAEGYQGHAYQFRARAHAASGALSAWSTAATQVPANAIKGHPFAGLYVLDAFGGMGPEDTPPLATSAYWPGWRIARTAHAVPGATSPQSGAVLDGYGGLHNYGGAFRAQITAYWAGWDIARDFAFLPNGSGGYVLDGYGGLHPFSANGGPMPPPTQGAEYWGWDIARKVVIFADGKGGYVLDGWGGIHAFGIGQPAPPNPVWTGYWARWDIAHDFALVPGTRSGYVMDGYGGLHSFAPQGQPQSPGLSGPYWSGWDIARGIWLLPSATVAQPAGYVLDGYGGLHPLGGAPAIVSGPYWQGSDVGRNTFGA